MSARVHDLAIVGAGLAGMATAIYAGNRGLRTVQIGNAGALLFSTGLLDLMGVHPVAEGRRWVDPWAGIVALVRDEPRHPYARVAPDEIRRAFSELVAAMAEAGLVYGLPQGENREVVTGLGTVKYSYCIPQTMDPGAQALADQARCLLVDFEGLREYSARAMSESLATRWPGLRTLRLDFPGPGVAGETNAAHVARALELAENRARLGALIRPHLGDAQFVGLPALLGIRRTNAIVDELSRSLGVPVFEVPTMPTSVPGLRLKEALEHAVAARGVQRLVHGRVVAVESEPTGFALSVQGEPSEPVIRARALVLATGRFMSGGLVADRRVVREPLLGLPVTQPASREAWHHSDLFDRRGHALNRAGLEVDGDFRPLCADGSLVHPRLFAVGTILAHHDWARMKCGAGLALATAIAAVRSIAGERET
jgi:glycerol-3-phosphate dehydrogenase subunit B